MLRSLRPKPHLTKLHIHDSVLFQQKPQTWHINRALLDNGKTQLISHGELKALQKSFESLMKGYNTGNLDYKDLIKLYSKVYYPFLRSEEIREFFGRDPRGSMARLQDYMIKHVRLTGDGISLLKHVHESSGLDFGVVRGDYFASLGITPILYGSLLRSSNKSLFSKHHKQNINYSKVINGMDGHLSATMMERYLKSSSSLHRAFNLKNYLVVNSPHESEMFVNLAQRFGISVIILTDKHFENPQSLVSPLLHDYQMCKLKGSTDQCDEIREHLSSLKFLPMKNVRELITFTNALEDVDRKQPKFDSASFDETLRQMELSILGNIETDIRHA